MAARAYAWDWLNAVLVWSAFLVVVGRVAWIAKGSTASAAAAQSVAHLA